MGDTYLVYTEIKRGNKWQCIDPYLPKLNKETGEKEMRLLTTYENGSRSCFSSTYDKLRELGYIKPDDLSDTLQTLHQRLHDDDPAWQWYYDEGCIVVSLRNLRNALPDLKQHQHCGVYHKDKIFAFEHGEREDLFEEDVLPAEYIKLPEELRKCYQYYEWDEPWDWPRYIRILLEKAQGRISDWMNFEFELDEPEARLVVYRF